MWSKTVPVAPKAQMPLRYLITPLLLNTLMPYVVLIVSIGVITTLIGLSYTQTLIPPSYVCVPWSEQALSSQLNIKIDSFWDWFFLNVILFHVTFLYGIVHKGTSFWTWDQSNYYRLSTAPEHARASMRWSMPFYLELPVMAFGGELLVTMFGYLGLLFSFVHVTYLLNTVLARGCVIITLNALKRRHMVISQPLI